MYKLYSSSGLVWDWEGIGRLMLSPSSAHECAHPFHLNIHCKPLFTPTHKWFHSIIFLMFAYHLYSLFQKWLHWRCFDVNYCCAVCGSQFIYQTINHNNPYYRYHVIITPLSTGATPPTIIIIYRENRDPSPIVIISIIGTNMHNMLTT